LALGKINEKGAIMKKRLRKKRHLKEFQELGFELNIEYDPAVDIDKIIDEVDKVIDSFNLCCGGGGGFGTIGYFVLRCNPNFYWNIGKFSKEFLKQHSDNPTLAEIDELNKLLRQIPHITKVEMGPVRDAWYGWE
jgi:uncharacterized protein YggL (DUF469 family)